MKRCPDVRSTAVLSDRCGGPERMSFASRREGAPLTFAIVVGGGRAEPSEPPPVEHGNPPDVDLIVRVGDFEGDRNSTSASRGCDVSRGFIARRVMPFEDGGGG